MLRASAQFDNREKNTKANNTNTKASEFEREILNISNNGFPELEDSENEKDEMWDTNYTAKFEINRMKEENSRIKAKILSFEVNLKMIHSFVFKHKKAVDFIKN